MTPEQTTDMLQDMHALAEHVLRQPAVGNRAKWLRAAIADLLTTNNNVLYYTQRYEDEYQYVDVANPYLVELLKDYDKEVN